MVGVLEIRTRGRRLVGADKTTELWRPLQKLEGYLIKTFIIQS